VMLILLDNALKHSSGTIRVTAESQYTQVMISVSDQGAGISPEALPHVFDRFFRGEASSTVDGYGLGLSIAKALVEGQGGRIAIESQVGVGSTVRVSIPRHVD
jgi:signal transduction histidine kinase